MKSSLVYSSGPRSIALGDLNNDQQKDILVAHFDNDSIGIFYYNGDGTFTNQKLFLTGDGSYPCSVAIDDFNNDTYLDVAVANYGINSISIFLGNRNGTLNDQRIISLNSSRPVFLSTSDFNNDDRIDIVVINNGNNTIGILLGDGNGYFRNQITYFTGYDSFSTSLVIADFNNDSYLDIAVTNSNTDSIGIFLGYGNGRFRDQQVYSTAFGSQPLSIAVGDVNNDDRLDLMVANNRSGNISIFLGHGDGRFQEQITYSISSSSHLQYIAVSDLNHDNALDIVVVDTSKDQIHVLPGDQTENFPLITTYDGILESSPWCVGLADWNNDNQSDIVVVNYGIDNVLVLLDFSISLTARQINYDTGTLYDTPSIGLSHFNNDSIIDAVYFTPSYLHLRLGNDDGTLGDEITYFINTNFIPQYLCLGDLNADNQTDIVVALYLFDSVGVLLGNGNASFRAAQIYSTGNNSNPSWVALGDINNDSHLDLVSANQRSGTISIFLGNGDGTFGVMMLYSSREGTEPYAVTLGDLNHDNYLDLAVIDKDNNIIISLGYGNGSFTIWNILHVGRSVFSVSMALADLNNDTHLDIIYPNTLADGMSIFLGNGNGTFNSEISYSTGLSSHPYVAFVADFNHDTILDIVNTNYGTDDLFMAYGLGNGSFRHDRTFSTGLGSKPYGIAAADFDHTNRMSIFVTLSGQKRIAILTEHNGAVFTNQTKYSTGSASKPLSVAVGDFNNDNRLDIVVANEGTDDLSILFGLDNTTFDMSTRYPIGADYDPHYVITCDINNDKQVDIVSVNRKVNSISVIMGYGNGTFAAQLIYSTGNSSHPAAIAAGDFNNDDRSDLVVVNEDTGEIGIFFGFNYVVFEKRGTYSSIDSILPVGIGVNDFNNDTYLDMVALFHGAAKIGILLGGNDGNFSAITSYSTGNSSAPYGVAIGDINNDHRLDLAIANYLTNDIGIFLGYGNGSFTPMTAYSSGNGSLPHSVAMGDLNNDDFLDMVTGNFGSNSIGILIGYGDGSFSNPTICLTGENSRPWSVALADFNNDGNLDIAVANYGSHNVGILLGYGTGTFTNQTILLMSVSSGPVGLAIGYFNNDSQLDIAVADRIDHKIGIFLGQGNGSFGTMQTYSPGDGSAPRFISIGDFNNDNKSDIAVSNEGRGSFVVLFGFGDGRFLAGLEHSSGPSSEPFGLAIGDFNHDNQLDVAVAGTGTNNMQVFFQYKSQPLGSMTILSTSQGSSPRSVAVGDLNNDGFLDIVVANYLSDNLIIIFGSHNENFKVITKNFSKKPVNPSSVAIADFNNDHNLDIVITNTQNYSIDILLGFGNGNFGNNTSYSIPFDSDPYSLKTGDFNNDGMMDIVFISTATNNVLSFYGYGDGTFQDRTPYVLGYEYYPTSIAVADFNNDHDLDFVITCYSTDHVEIFTRSCQ